METDLESIKRRQDLLEAYMNALELRLDIVADRISLINLNESGSPGLVTVCAGACF
jgi:hypothetical protein